MDNPTLPVADAPAQPREAIAARYVGAGEYWPGVPARDLTVSEWTGLDPATRQAVLTNGLYIEEG